MKREQQDLSWQRFPLWERPNTVRLGARRASARPNTVRLGARRASARPPGRERSSRSHIAALALLLASLPALAAEPAERDTADTMPAGVIELDETVISGNQELPKVLYIVPWQQPDGLPEIELSTDFAEAELFRRLYPPAYRRELAYFEASRAGAASTAPADAGSDSKVSDSKE